MRHPTPSPRPPRLAAWLVSLFGSSRQAESILGDLAEEFSDIASQSGVASARRWYWRQSLKTIAHLTGSSFRTAPWSLAGIIFAGFLLCRFSFGLPELVVVTILRTQRPYSNLHVEDYVRFVTYGIPIAGVFLTMLIGCIVSVLAKGREMVATTALTFLAAVPLGLLFLRVGGPWSRFAYSWPFVIIQLLDLSGIVLGAVIVREIRLALARRFSRT
jgi:hypothetical protein